MLLVKEKAGKAKNQLQYGKYHYDSNFVCTKDYGKPAIPNSIKYYSSLVEKNLGFSSDFYNLYHTHATILLEVSAKPKEIQMRLGYANIR